jgi:hypothetical protein
MRMPCVFFNSVDADEEPLSGPRLGRLINHGNKRCERNAKMRVLVDGTIPVLCLFATKRIAAAEQVLYDYGVKVPWLCKVSYVYFSENVSME